jgi:hypothetical protein
MISLISTAFLVVFILILVSLHFLKRELDPKWRMISEYEIGKHGWLMRIAFVSWGLSVMFLMIHLASNASTFNMIVTIWLAIIAIANFGAGAFITDPITNISKSVQNTLHTICGAIVILTFPIISTIVAVTISGKVRHELIPFLILATSLTWVGQIGFFASSWISQKLDPSAGRVGPTIYLGWPNRIMVLFYASWICTISWMI